MSIKTNLNTKIIADESIELKKIKGYEHISIPHGTMIGVQKDTQCNIVSVSSLPVLGQMIAITFNSFGLSTYSPSVVFQTDTNEVSLPMYIFYKGRAIPPSMITTLINSYSTHLFVIKQDPTDPENTILSLIGDLDAGIYIHSSTTTSYGVGTTSYYGHVKTITGDLSTITSYTDGHAAAAYHLHSNYLTSSQLSAGYKKTFYLRNVSTIEEPEEVGITINRISFQVNEILSYDLEYGDVLIFPINSSKSFSIDSSDYNVLSRLTIRTPSGDRTFTFRDNFFDYTRFKVVYSGYKLICVVEDRDYLRLLNPIDCYRAWNAYSATTANYATTANSAMYANHALDANTATQANKLLKQLLIDGLFFNGTTHVNHYGVCTAVANTAIKNVSIPGLGPAIGAIARVKFTNEHAVTSTSLANKARLVLNDIPFTTSNDEGVIRAYSTGVCLPSENSWAPGQIVEMIYDGTYWNIISPYIVHNGTSVNGGIYENGDDAS